MGWLCTVVLQENIRFVLLLSDDLMAVRGADRPPDGLGTSVNDMPRSKLNPRALTTNLSLNLLFCSFFFGIFNLILLVFEAVVILEIRLVIVVCSGLDGLYIFYSS